MGEKPTASVFKLLAITGVAVLGLPVTFLFWLLGLIFHAKIRVFTILAMIVAGLWYWFVGLPTRAPPSPGDTLSRGEIGQIYSALLTRVDPKGHNHLHCRRLFFYSEKFAS